MQQINLINEYFKFCQSHYNNWVHSSVHSLAAIIFSSPVPGQPPVPTAVDTNVELDPAVAPNPSLPEPTSNLTYTTAAHVTSDVQLPCDDSTEKAQGYQALQVPTFGSACCAIHHTTSSWSISSQYLGCRFLPRVFKSTIPSGIVTKRHAMSVPDILGQNTQECLWWYRYCASTCWCRPEPVDVNAPYICDLTLSSGKVGIGCFSLRDPHWKLIWLSVNQFSVAEFLIKRAFMVLSRFGFCFGLAFGLVYNVNFIWDFVHLGKKGHLWILRRLRFALLA